MNSVLLLLVNQQHSKRHLKFLKLIFYVELYFLGVSSQKDLWGKTGPASQEAGDYKGVTQTECGISGSRYILNSVGAFSGVANHPKQGKLFPVQSHLSQRG